MKTLLKNLNIIAPHQKLSQKADIVIEDGKISFVGKVDEKNSFDKIYDFDGKYCSIGFFDMHVHLREPGREDEETIETGCESAAAGGFTGVLCMPNTDPCIDDAETVKYIIDRAKEQLVDVYPAAAATKERKGESISPMLELAKMGAKAFTDDGAAIKTAKILRIAMEYSLMTDCPIIEHCEEDSLSGGAMNESFNSTLLGLPTMPSISEELIVMRDIMMAEFTGARLHIAHISTKKSVEYVRLAKQKGIKVTAEVAPHHFTLTDDELKTYDTNYKMNPPLRTQEDIDAIIEGLADGTIDAIATDHAPHTPEEKDLEFIYAPNGIVGLETAFALAISELYKKKKLSLEQLIEKFAINPRKILNIPLPTIEIGQKANLTIFDPELIWTVDASKFKSKCNNTPFDKRLVSGKSIATINNSKIYFEGKYSNI